MWKIIIVAVIVAAIVGWHILVCLRIENESYEVNWLTDIATLKLPSAASAGITSPEGIAGFNWGRNLIGAPEAERQLSLYARRYVDVYAVLIPYRVNIVDKQAAPIKTASIQPTQTPQQWPDIRPEMQAEMTEAEHRLFGTKVSAEIDTYQTGQSGSLHGSLAVMGGCKPHDCGDHNAMWVVDFSTGQAGRAAGEITNEAEVVVYLGDYQSPDDLPPILQAEIKEQSTGAWPSPKPVRYVVGVGK